MTLRQPVRWKLVITTSNNGINAQILNEHSLHNAPLCPQWQRFRLELHALLGMNYREQK